MYSPEVPSKHNVIEGCVHRPRRADALAQQVSVALLVSWHGLPAREHQTRPGWP